MRSKFLSLFSAGIAGVTLLAGSIFTAAPAGASLPGVVTATTQGLVWSLAARGDGSFTASAYNISNNQSGIVTFDARGTAGSQTVIPNGPCGAEPYALSVTPIFGSSDPGYLYALNDGQILIHLNGTTRVVGSIPAGTFLGGALVSPPDADGQRSVYLEYNVVADGSAYIDVTAFDSSFSPIGGTEVNDPALGSLTSPTLVGHDLYVVNQASGALLRVSGHLFDTGFTVSTVVPSGTFNHPRSVAVDDNGNLYVTDNGTDTLYQVSPDGTVSNLGTYGTPVPVNTSPRRLPPLEKIATSMVFEPSSRSLIIARAESLPPGARRNCTVASPTTSFLRIHTAPLAPSNVSVTANGSSATVSWGAPADQRDGDRFTVTASPGGASCTAVAPQTSCIVTGLSAMSTYQFEVLAQSEDGLGTATAMLTASAGLAATGDSSGFLALGGLLLTAFGLGTIGLRRRMSRHTKA